MPATTNVEVRSDRAFVRPLQLLVVVMLIAQVGLAFRSTSLLIARPFIEDSFYALSVARSIGAGEGFTVDGVHPTNGVQPLICLMYAPIYALTPSDGIEALRPIYLLQALIGLLLAIAAATLVSRMDRIGGRERLVWWSTVTLIYLDYTLSVHVLNGLESGLTTMLTLIGLLLFERLRANRVEEIWRWGLFGMYVGVMILSRIDAGFFAVSIALLLLYDGVRNGSKSNGVTTWRRVFPPLKKISVIAIGALLLSLPWWWYNASTFGSVMPISGLSQYDLSGSLRHVVVETVNVLADAVVPSLHTPVGLKWEGVAWPGLAIVAVILLLAIVPTMRNRIATLMATYRREWSMRPLQPLLLHLVLLFLFYTIFFQAPHFQSRYLILVTLVAGLFHVTLWVTVIRNAHTRRMRAALFAMFVIVQLVSLGLFVRNYTGHGSNMMLETFDWINASTRRDDRIGMFQSGTLGYLLPDRVTNLDGKVNAEALRAMRSGRLPRYVDSLRFDYIVDWEGYTDRIFVDSTVRQRYHPVHTMSNGMIAWRRYR